MPADLTLFSPGLALAAFFLSALLTGLATAYALRRGLLDRPGERHSHAVATPRGGGIGPVLVILAAGAWGWLSADQAWLGCLLPGALLVGVVGWADDHRSLSPWWRLAAQVAAAVLLVAGLAASEMGERNPLAAWPVMWVVYGLFVVWMTNLYNFMDGSNGMAGAQGVFAGALLAWLFGRAGDPAAALFSVAVAAACAGFLPWNLGRARVFMGDVGSVALGFVFGGLLVYGVISGRLALPVAWLVMLPFLLDATLTLLLRVKRGERWYTPHKQHLYQRLIERGWTHTGVLLLYQSVNLALVVPAIGVAVRYPGVATGLAVVLSLALGGAWLVAMKKLGVLAFAG